ncbi:MAG: tetrahydromethanopterin S-methyltransferase subunit A [Candidatus Hecatellales archaeon B24]|nr:MAG: tetrahydromethanopterin S-methyltransferase subunit A [Candidatus Hecatellales archaeon B24]
MKERMSGKKRRVVSEVYPAEAALLEALISDVKTRVLLAGLENRFSAGFYNGMVKGFMIGLIVSLLFFGVVFAYFVP